MVALATVVPWLAHCGSRGSAPRAGDALGMAADSGACAAGASDGGMQRFAGNDARIQYVGRLDLSDPAGPWFSASAVYVTAKFRGDHVAAEIRDEPLQANDLDFFDVIVDDRPPFRLSLASRQAVYELAPAALGGDPLVSSSCEHTVTLIKRTEAIIGKAQLLGLSAAGLLPPDPSPTPGRRIEFVGDSYACGFGIEVTSPASVACAENGRGQGGNGQGVEDAYEAYGPVVARILGAQWHVTCESGVGLVRNNWIPDPRPMPELYPLLHPGEPPDALLWPVTQWGASGNVVVPGTPDLVVIGLGGNDLADAVHPIPVGGPLGGPDGGPSLVQGFVQFISRLATSYPGVSILLVSNTLVLRAATQIVADYYAPGGNGAEANVHVYGYHDDLPYPGDGCQGDPNAAQQANAAAGMAGYIARIMRW